MPVALIIAILIAVVVAVVVAVVFSILFGDFSGFNDWIVATFGDSPQ